MRRWIEEKENREYIQVYLRIDYVVNGAEQEKRDKMSAFKEELNKYIINKHIDKDYLIDAEDEIRVDNIVPEFRASCVQCLNQIWAREDSESNIKALLGETLCAWLCESFDDRPLYQTPTKTGNYSEQGTDRWELRKREDDRIFLRVWSAKCTTGRPSGRAEEIRRNDFSTTEISGIFAQITEIVQNIENPPVTPEELKAMKLSLLGEDSRLSLGVVIVFDLSTYQEMYEGQAGRPLRLFVQEYADHAEKIIRFFPIEDLLGYVRNLRTNSMRLIGENPNE